MDAIIRLVFLVLGVQCILKASAYEDTLGNLVEMDTAKETDGSGVFLFDNVELPEAVVFEFSAYCVRTTPVWFQIWRAVDELARVYSLVGQRRLVPEEVPRLYKVRMDTREEMIFTQAGDRLGIYSEGEVSALGYRMDFTSQVYRLSVVTSDDLFVGKEAQFLDLPFPYLFSAAVTFDTDIQRFLTAGTGTLIPPTVPPSTRATIPHIPPNEGTVVYSGNSLAPRDRALTENARGLYLFHHLKFRRGVIVALYAYFVRKEPVWFQVWRQVPGNEEVFMLVGQVLVEPYRVPKTEEFILDRSNYIFTEDNDMLGMMVNGSVSAVGYNWNPSGDAPRPFGAQYDSNDMPYPGYNATFTAFGLPYDMGIGAKYDTVRDPAMYGTPKPILVTSATTTTTTTTTLATTTLPSTFPSNMVGRENIRYTNRFLPNGAMKTFLLSELQFTGTSRVTSFWAYIANSGRIQFQVWRKVSDDSAEFTLIGYKDYESQISDEFVEVPLDPVEQFEAQRGDCLGFSNDQDISVLGYHFQTVELYFSEGISGTPIGNSMTFERLPFPYNFALAAGYTEVVSTTTPVPEESTTTFTSKPTTPSTTGPSTPSTTTKKTGPPDNRNAVPVLGEAKAYGWLLDPTVLLGMFIWLIVLTVLFLILCLVVACRLNKSRNVRYNRQPYSFTNPANTTRPNSFNQWGSMKSDEGMDYFNPTIGKSRQPPGNSRDGVTVQRSLSGSEDMSTRERPVKTKVVGNEKYTHM